MDINNVRIKIGDLAKLPGVGKKTVEAAREFVTEYPEAFAVELDTGEAVAEPVYLYSESEDKLLKCTGDISDEVKKEYPNAEVITQEEYEKIERERKVFKNSENLSPNEEDMDSMIKIRTDLFNVLCDADRTIEELIKFIKSEGKVPNIRLLQKWKLMLEETEEVEDAQVVEEVEEIEEVEEDDLSWL